jgi:hypothetical protein
MKFAVLVALFCTFALAKDAARYCPPEFWTHVKMSKCKQVATDKMHCEAEITFAGYSVKKPAQDRFDVKKWKFEVGSETPPHTDSHAAHRAWYARLALARSAVPAHRKSNIR